MTIIANEPINRQKVKNAEKIMASLIDELTDYTNKGSGPFLAALYDENGTLIAKAANTVITEKCCLNHAEMNVIEMVQKKLNTHDLSTRNLTLYVTAEPCMMCLGAILWSGIRTVYFSVPSADVEKITGFDEGFKPGWLDEFQKRGITVYGGIKQKDGKQALKAYIDAGKPIYKPER